MRIMRCQHLSAALDHATPRLETRLTLGAVDDARIGVWPERTFALLNLGHPSSGEKQLPSRVLAADQLAALRDRLQRAREARGI